MECSMINTTCDKLTADSTVDYWHPICDISILHIDSAVGKSRWPPYSVMLFCYLHTWFGPNDFNELCILSHMDVAATAKTSVVCFIPTQQKTYRRWNLLCRYIIICKLVACCSNLRTRRRNQLCIVSLSIAQKGPEMRIIWVL